MLAELVKAGRLPPVEERLPQNPCVCPLLETVGKYGGTLRRGHKGVADRVGPTKLNAQTMNAWNFDVSVRPNVCESWEQNATASEFTYKLRKGMKWSDGAPFDSDAFKWWYERQLMDKRLTPSISPDWATGPKKTVMIVECPDKYTVKIKFADPNPLFPYKLCGHWLIPYNPGHYMQKFHIDTTDNKTALEEATKKAGFDAWDKYFADRDSFWLNPEKPVVMPFVGKSKLSDELYIMERNPYFFQVDKDGNQLPYMDKLTHRLFTSPDVLTMWILNGEIDFFARHTSAANYTLYKQNEQKGDYKVVDVLPTGFNVVVPNQTTKSKRLREFNQNRDVRIALSHAINRKEINELIFDGRGTVGQYTPAKGSPYYSEKALKAYVEYDPKKANELLDKAGYKKGPDGFRLWKDGSNEPVSFIIESYIADTGTASADEIGMIVKYFAAVGIKCAWKYVERSLSEKHISTNDVEWYQYGAGRGAVPLLDPVTWTGQMWDVPWCLAWGYWRSDKTNTLAEEPPADHYVRKIWDTIDRILMEPDEKKRIEMFKSVTDIWAEELPAISTVGWIPHPFIVKNGLRNFKGGYPFDNTLNDEGFVPIQSLFWDEPDKHK